MSLEKELKRLDELRFAEDPEEAIDLFLKVREKGEIEHIRSLCLLFENKVEQPVQVEFLIDTIAILIDKDVKQGIKEVVNSLSDIHKRGDRWIYFLNRSLLSSAYFEAYVEEVKHSDIEIKKIIKPHLLELKDRIPMYENSVNKAIERMEL